MLKRFFFSFFVIFLLFNTAFATKVKESKKILVLLSYHAFIPWSIGYLEGLNRAKQLYGDNIEIYLENMETIRLKKGSLTDREWIDYLKKKYKKIEFDAVITESNKASIFISKYKNELFLKSIPFVSYASGGKNSKKDMKRINIFSYDYVEKNLELISKFHPNLKNLFIIKGDVKSASFIIDKIKIKVKKYLPKTKLEIFENFTIAQLYKKLSKLSKDTVVIYTIFFKDRDNNKFIPKHEITNLAKLSTAPMYSFYRPLIDTGIIGGYMIDAELTGLNSINSAIDLINDTEKENPYISYKLTLDWNIIKLFKIDKKLIPKDAEIINKPISILDLYLLEVSIAGLLITILIILLIVAIYLNINRKKLIISLENETQNRIDREKILIEQSKMATLGKMIGAIAHQWKQPLSLINIKVQDLILAQEFEELDENYLKNSCKKIENNVMYMSQTIDDFRNFFKPNKEKKEFFLRDSLEKVVNIVSSEIENYEIDIEILENDILIKSIPNEIEQILINIINNAKEVLIERKIENPYIKISQRESEDKKYVVISVEDNAGGIKDDILNKIFDLHFSTKGKKGDGLGLYMSQLIAKESLGGSITVKNREKGAIFELMILKSLE